MLKNGQFIKEELPKIGILYEPKPFKPDTPEEKFVRNIVLGRYRYHSSFVSQLIGKVLRL